MFISVDDACSTVFCDGSRSIQISFLFRVEELRLRLEQSRLQIVQLQGENQHLKQQFEITLREKERMYQMRERVNYFFTISNDRLLLTKVFALIFIIVFFILSNIIKFYE